MLKGAVAYIMAEMRLTPPRRARRLPTSRICQPVALSEEGNGSLVAARLSLWSPVVNERGRP